MPGTTTGGRDRARALVERDRAEQLTNAVYGSILVTAFLGAVDASVASAVEILVEMVLASFVLFVAHTYSSLLATGVVEHGELGHHAGSVVRNQVPLVTVVAVPSLLLLPAAVGLLPLELAIGLALGVEIAGLFGLGYLLAAESGRSTAGSAVAGALGAGLGMVVVGLETALH